MGEDCQNAGKGARWVLRIRKPADVCLTKPEEEDRDGHTDGAERKGSYSDEPSPPLVPAGMGYGTALTIHQFQGEAPLAPQLALHTARITPTSPAQMAKSTREPALSIAHRMGLWNGHGSDRYRLAQSLMRPW